MIIERMEQAARDNREHYRAYVITRQYRIFTGRAQQPSAEVLADVSFVPPKTKEFTITGTKGSARGETVVRRILENEQKAAETGQAPGAMGKNNYDFTLDGEQPLDGHDCFVLGLKPKRKEKSLVAGQAWVDKQTYLVRRVEGRLAKMPSWWIKSVNVTLDFSDVSGMWLQTHTTANADVRMFGPHSLQENAIKVRTGPRMAKVTLPQARAEHKISRAEEMIESFEP